LTEELAGIIRRCWHSDPAMRTSLVKVAKSLMEQQAVLFESEEASDLDNNQMLGINE